MYDVVETIGLCHYVSESLICILSYVWQPNDCGLFTVAFAMDICLGQTLEDLHFYVKLMRSQLSSYLP